MRIAGLLVAALLLAMTPVGAEPGPGEETSECQAPNFTVRDLVVYTCEDGRWVPLGCQVPFCIRENP